MALLLLPFAAAGCWGQAATKPAHHAAAAARPSPPPSATPAGPGRLVIPAIGVDAAIESVGMNARGDMDTPHDAKEVAWYAPGVRPGDSGDAVMAGHLDWYTGPAVFWHLRDLKVGDTITVERPDGSRLEFHVTRLTSVRATQPPPYLFRAGGRPTLSLITCTGRWDGKEYSQRLIVDATL